MNNKFGQFEWHCWKDKKPDEDKYIYVYICDEDIKDTVDIGTADEYSWDENMYWYYVFMPDAPKIEKELSLEDRIKSLEDKIDLLMRKIHASTI